MKRNLNRVAAFLKLIEEHADEAGIVLGRLIRKWKKSGPKGSMTYAECFYLLTLCESAGFITVKYYWTTQRIVQLTWSGHEFMDSHPALSGDGSDTG